MSLACMKFEAQNQLMIKRTEPVRRAAARQREREREALLDMESRNQEVIDLLAPHDNILNKFRALGPPWTDSVNLLGKNYDPSPARFDKRSGKTLNQEAIEETYLIVVDKLESEKPGAWTRTEAHLLLREHPRMTTETNKTGGLKYVNDMWEKNRAATIAAASVQKYVAVDGLGRPVTESAIITNFEEAL